MIKLQRLSAPSYLTSKKVQELTAEYRTSKKAVWNNCHLKTSLLKSSHNKCAYCECLLTKESNYMEVEHFEDKKNNPNKVVCWQNLLPSCKKCNGAKGSHNVLSEPIINPYDDDPKNHLSMRLYRMVGKTDKGKSTIQVTRLNHSTRLVQSRFAIGEKLHDLIETSYDRYKSFSKDKNNTILKNKLLNIVEGMLIECQPNSEYSASTATLLLTDDKFIELINNMKLIGIWTDELENYYSISQKLVLDYV